MRKITWLLIGALAGCGGGYNYGGERSSGDPPPPTPNGQGGGAGAELTAGAWDDNLNFGLYRSYLANTTALSGAPQIPRDDRVSIWVTDRDGRPLPAATVTVAADQQPPSTLLTGGEGGAYYFPAWEGGGAGDLAVTAERDGVSRTVTARGGDQVALQLDVAGGPPASLDIALVLDTTGSMGDELAYLTHELQTIAQAISDRFPAVAMRWALVVYRDEGDLYVTSTFDFTSDLAAFRATLGAQDAGGGGDYPEAPERALADAAQLSWRADARVAFWVADAPHHANHAGAMTAALAATHARGVHLYPVAASGADSLVEFTMRTGAQVTGGRYLFLTDDSGIGNHHAEPTLPCYLVTRLKDAMSRMAAIELTGHRFAPDPAQVVRAAGDPVGGVCQLGGGGTALAF